MFFGLSYLHSGSRYDMPQVLLKHLKIQINMWAFSNFEIEKLAHWLFTRKGFYNFHCMWLQLHQTTFYDDLNSTRRSN